MKKIIISLALAIASLSCAEAQEVYNEIRNKAVEHINDPLANDMVKQVNTFKRDALDYMLIKMREQMPDSTVAFLDRQAYAMNSFVNFYVQKIIESSTLPQAKQVQIVKLFMDASYSNPLFNDPDGELTLGYYANGNCLTRFSLDTDWRRAVAAVMAEIKKME